MLAGQALVKYLLLREQTLLRRTHSSGIVKDVFFLFPFAKSIRGRIPCEVLGKLF